MLIRVEGRKLNGYAQMIEIVLADVEQQIGGPMGLVRE